MNRIPPKRLAIAIIIIFIALWALSEFGKTRNAMLLTPGTPSTTESGVAMSEPAGSAPAPIDSMAQRGLEFDSSQKMIAPDVMPNPVPPTDVKERLVVKNGSISLIVKELQPTIDRVNQIAQGVNGFVVNSSVYGGDPVARPMPLERGRPMPTTDGMEYSQPTTPTQANVTLRVPAEQMEAVMAQIRQLGIRVTAESTNTDDVTDQFIDIQARLRNLQATEAQLQRLLERATTVSDTLQVSNQLTQTRSQIESLQGQVNYYNQSAKLSQITVNMTVEPASVVKTPIESWNPQIAFKEAIAGLINTLTDIANGAIKLAVYAVIWLPLLLIGYFLYRKFIKPRQSRNPLS